MESLVSVIIPSYNHEKYIYDCVMSVINQTYKNLEILVMDDCSTDESIKTLTKIKDKRLTVIVSKQNNGTVLTLNELTKKCKGEYIAVIGSDDIWMEDKIEKQIEYFYSHPNIGAIFTNAEIIDENGNLYVDDEKFNKNVFKCENISSGKRMRLFFENGNHLCHSSSLIKKEVIKKIGLYDLSLRQLHDYEYWIRLINNYDIYILNEKLVKYRRFKNSNQNLSNNLDKSVIRVINENNIIMEKLFKEIDDKKFIEGFKDLFMYKNSKTKEELLCEKYFILLGNRYQEVFTRQIALSLIFTYGDKKKLFNILKEKFNYTLNDFYEDTGKLYETFNSYFLSKSDLDIGILIKNQKSIIDEQTKIINNRNETIDSLNSIINRITNSLLWKVTAPLRFIKRKLKNGNK